MRRWIGLGFGHCTGLHRTAQHTRAQHSTPERSLAGCAHAIVSDVDHFTSLSSFIFNLTSHHSPALLLQLSLPPRQQPSTPTTTSVIDCIDFAEHINDFYASADNGARSLPTSYLDLIPHHHFSLQPLGFAYFHDLDRHTASLTAIAELKEAI